MIIEERLGISFEVMDDIALAIEKDFLINYSDESLDKGIKIMPNGILSSKVIEPIPLQIQRWKHTTVLFYNQPNALIPFDLFGAVFYLISRYEEYLPHKKDKHDRFPAASSVAYQYKFLDMPVVDIWIKELGVIIENNTSIKVKQHALQTITTIDIDLLWKYEGKSWLKNLLIKTYYAIYYRKKSFRKNKNEDPYFCFDRIKDTLIQNDKNAIFFILNPKVLSKYDRIKPLENRASFEMLQGLLKHFEIGIHPSYHSIQNNCIHNEIHTLSHAMEYPVTKSRMHYIKLDIPDTYQSLSQLNIKQDYTMGYPDQNGFRASTNFPYLWYDLVNEQVTELIINPFCFMDATSIFYLRQNSETASHHLNQLLSNASRAGGNFTTIWHNYIIGDESVHMGWWQLWSEFVGK